MRARLLLLLLLPALAACGDGSSSDAPAADTTAAAEPEENADDTLEARARAAGISPAIQAQLTALDQLVVVPGALGAFTLSGEPVIYSEGSQFSVEIPYTGSDGACVVVRTTNDGIGDVPWGESESRTVRMPEFGIDAEVFKVSTDPTDDDAVTMGAGAAGTPWIAMGDTFFSVLSPGNEAPGCGPASQDDVAQLVASLRPLDPARDAVH